jgi:hypothetical protein
VSVSTPRNRPGSPTASDSPPPGVGLSTPGTGGDLGPSITVGGGSNSRAAEAAEQQSRGQPPVPTAAPASPPEYEQQTTYPQSNGGDRGGGSGDGGVYSRYDKSFRGGSGGGVNWQRGSPAQVGSSGSRGGDVASDSGGGRRGGDRSSGRGRDGVDGDSAVGYSASNAAAAASTAAAAARRADMAERRFLRRSRAAATAQLHAWLECVRRRRRIRHVTESFTLRKTRTCRAAAFRAWQGGC